MNTYCYSPLIASSALPSKFLFEPLYVLWLGSGCRKHLIVHQVILIPICRRRNCERDQLPMVLRNLSVGGG